MAEPMAGTSGYASELEDALTALNGLRRENMALKCALNQSERKAAAESERHDRATVVRHGSI